jgi:hypothetical protein
LTNEALKNTWKVRLREWRESGLKVLAWCRKNNISYQTFYYWRSKLENQSNKPRPQIIPSNFMELSDKAPNEVGFTIEVQGMVFQLSKNFDEAVFLKCISLLRRLSC